MLRNKWLAGVLVAASLCAQDAPDRQAQLAEQPVVDLAEKWISDPRPLDSCASPECWLVALSSLVQSDDGIPEILRRWKMKATVAD